MRPFNELCVVSEPDGSLFFVNPARKFLWRLLAAV
jgi:hypothetical protein